MDIPYNTPSNLDRIAPARSAFAITPHDTTAIAIPPRAVRVGVGGTIVLRGLDDNADVTIQNVASGETLLIRPAYIRATGTTASNIIGVA